MSFVLEPRPESSQGRGSDPFYARGFLINPNDTKRGLRVEALVDGSFVERSGLLRIGDKLAEIDGWTPINYPLAVGRLRKVSGFGRLKFQRIVNKPSSGGATSATA